MGTIDQYFPPNVGSSDWTGGRAPAGGTHTGLAEIVMVDGATFVVAHDAAEVRQKINTAPPAAVGPPLVPELWSAGLVWSPRRIWGPTTVIAPSWVGFDQPQSAVPIVLDVTRIATVVGLSWLPGTGGPPAPAGPTIIHYVWSPLRPWSPLELWEAPPGTYPDYVWTPLRYWSPTSLWEPPPNATPDYVWSPLRLWSPTSLWEPPTGRSPTYLWSPLRLWSPSETWAPPPVSIAMWSPLRLWSPQKLWKDI